MFLISSFSVGLCMDGDVVALSPGQVYLVLCIRKNIQELSTPASKSVNRSSRLILQPRDNISLKPMTTDLAPFVLRTFPLEDLSTRKYLLRPSDRSDFRLVNAYLA